MQTKSKKLWISLAFLMLALIALPAFMTVKADAASDITIYGADVSDFTEPKIGALPDTDVTVGMEFGYTAKVVWLYETGSYFSKWDTSRPFASSETYKVEITLSPKSGYKFNSNVDIAVRLNGKNTDYTYVNGGKNILISKTYKTDSYITNVGITGLIPAAAGELADYDVGSVYGTHTTSVVWVNEETKTAMKSGEKFSANTAYTAQLHLYAKDGYCFKDAESIKATVNGTANHAIEKVSDKELVLYMYYNVGIAPVRTVSVILDAPMPGMAPDYTAQTDGDGYVKDYTGEGYIHGVRWMDSFTKAVMAEDDTFVAGRSYTVSVIVVAGEDYEFTSERRYIYINSRVSSEKTNANANERVCETVLQTPDEISEINISKMAEPEEGNTPDYWLDVDVDGVTVEAIEWGVLTVCDDGVERVVDMGENETFEDGKTYAVTIRLKNSTSKVFATKVTPQSRRYVVTMGAVDGEKVHLKNWQEYDAYNVLRDKDPYYYAEILIWYTCESAKATKAVAFIDTPIAGETPDYNPIVAGGDLYIKSVEWGVLTLCDDGVERVEKIESYSKFEKNKSYYVTIILGTLGNTKLAYDPEYKHYNMEGFVNHKSANFYPVLSFDGYATTEVDPYHQVELTCWFSCYGEIIETVDISGIRAPIAGEYPSYDRTILGAGYVAKGEGTSWDGKQDVYRMKNGVQWYDVTGGGLEYVYENERFIGGHTYEVWISLEITGSNRFAVDGDNLTTVAGWLNGYEAIVEEAVLSNQTLYLRMRYAFTCERVALDQINVEIPMPVIGGTPSWDKINTDYFYSNSSIDGTGGMQNGISWVKFTENVVADPLMYGAGDTFEENTEYRVAVYISLQEGFYIADSEEFEVYLNGIRVFSAMVLGDPSNAVLLSYTFEKTDCNCSILPVGKVGATCTEPGMEAHFSCEKCGQKYKDANGEELLDEGETWGIIWPSGHDFKNFAPHDDYNNCHIGTCACGETEVADCEYVGVFVEGPSGYSKYDVTVFRCRICGAEGAFYVDESSCEHIVGAWESNERMGGVHFRSCECGKVYEEADCDYVISVVRGPSEYSDLRDVYLYTCKVCGGEHIQPIEGEILTEDAVTDAQTNVTVSVPVGSETVLPQGTTVEAKPVEAEDITEGAKDMMEETLHGDVEILSGYNITLYYNTTVIQPSEIVTVCFPMGAGVSEADADDLSVIYYDDYTIQVIPAVTYDWKNGTVMFETDHFSKYLLVKIKTEEYMFSYYPGEAEGSPDSDIVMMGTVITLAPCMFTAPAGKQFKAWAIGGLDGERKQPGETITITAETYIYAIWEDAGSGYLESFKNAVAGLTANATADVAYGELLAALSLYAKLTDAEKTAAAEDFEALRGAIEVYNAKADAANNALMDATKIAFVPITVSFAFLSALWFLLKKKFML